MNSPLELFSKWRYNHTMKIDEVTSAYWSLRLKNIWTPQSSDFYYEQYKNGWRLIDCTAFSQDFPAGTECMSAFSVAELFKWFNQVDSVNLSFEDCWIVTVPNTNVKLKQVKLADVMAELIWIMQRRGSIVLIRPPS